MAEGSTDQGWGGAWDPKVVNEGTIAYLRDVVGTASLRRNGRPHQWLAVDLQSGEYVYPIEYPRAPKDIMSVRIQ